MATRRNPFRPPSSALTVVVESQGSNLYRYNPILYNARTRGGLVPSKKVGGQTSLNLFPGSQMDISRSPISPIPEPMQISPNGYPRGYSGLPRSASSSEAMPMQISPDGSIGGYGGSPGEGTAMSLDEGSPNSLDSPDSLGGDLIPTMGERLGELAPQNSPERDRETLKHLALGKDRTFQTLREKYGGGSVMQIMAVRHEYPLPRPDDDDFYMSLNSDFYVGKRVNSLYNTGFVAIVSMIMRLTRDSSDGVLREYLHNNARRDYLGNLSGYALRGLEKSYRMSPAPKMIYVEPLKHEYPTYIDYHGSSAIALLPSPEREGYVVLKFGFDTEAIANNFVTYITERGRGFQPLGVPRMTGPRLG